MMMMVKEMGMTFGDRLTIKSGFLVMGGRLIIGCAGACEGVLLALRAYPKDKDVQEAGRWVLKLVANAETGGGLQQRLLVAGAMEEWLDMAMVCFLAHETALCMSTRDAIAQS